VFNLLIHLNNQTIQKQDSQWSLGQMLGVSQCCKNLMIPSSIPIGRKKSTNKNMSNVLLCRVVNTESKKQYINWIFF